VADEAVKETVKDTPSFRSAAKVGAKMRQFAIDLKTALADVAALKEKNTSLESQIATLTTENSGLKSQVSNPSADRKRVQELLGEIKAGKHKAAFAKLAKDAGAAEDLIEDLYERSGYKAEADDPDDEALAAVLDELKEKKPSAFRPPAKADETTTAAKTVKTPAGTGRGAPAKGGEGTIITAEQRADPMFMLNPKNKQIIAAAAKEGRFR
jgi:hypothetical protein